MAVWPLTSSLFVERDFINTFMYRLFSIYKHMCYFFAEILGVEDKDQIQNIVQTAGRRILMINPLLCLCILKKKAREIQIIKTATIQNDDVDGDKCHVYGN